MRLVLLVLKFIFSNENLSYYYFFELELNYEKISNKTKFTRHIKLKYQGY